MSRPSHEAIEESLKLECALGSLRTSHHIALTHYAPIEATIIGERPEIFPYLGTSRLEDSLQRYPVHMAFHWHAHSGTSEGRTSRGVPVYNVAMPLLLRSSGKLSGSLSCRPERPRSWARNKPSYFKPSRGCPLRTEIDHASDDRIALECCAD